jgi:hypothetical protein
MNENQRNQSGSEQQNTEQDQLRNPTTNEVIREVGQDRGENETLRDAEQGSGRSYDYGTQGSEQAGSNNEQASNNNMNTGRNSSRETMAGTTDMSHDQEMGSGRDVRRTQGSGQNLAPKLGTTGSDFDGQNSI